MKSRKFSISSEDGDDSSFRTNDSDDRVLLKKGGNSYSSLCKHSWERCEFCDEIFANRYSIYKHNISHIIIPLIKQTTHQCEQCLYHFTSLEKLALHISTKHKNLLVTDCTSVKLKFEDDHYFKEQIPDFKEQIPEMTNILKSIVEKQVIVKCDDELKEVFLKCNELKNKNGMSRDNIEHMQLNANNILVKEPLKEELPNPTYLVKECTSSASEEEKESMRHRLLFEEDLEDTLFNELSADYNLNIETLCEQINLDFDEPIAPLPQINDSQTNNTITKSNSAEIIYNNSKVKEYTTDLLQHGKAIHYDILMVPEVCKCKWCWKDFPNRFQLLQHEPQHLKVKLRWRAPFCAFCERYIPGNYHNLHAHMEKKHPHATARQRNIHNCPRCGLKYFNYAKHIKYYHEVYKCAKCDRGFETARLMNEHRCGEVQLPYESDLTLHSNKVPTDYTGNSQDQFEAVMMLCQMCYSFMKIYMQNRQNYELVGRKSQVGMQQTCDKCNIKVFEVNVVSRKKLKHKQFDVKDMSKSRRHVTNEKRLKNIQNRLKMIKKINKC